MRPSPLLLALVLLCGIPVQARAEGTRRALLVGCTKYDHLPEHRWLEGCGNDVKLLRTLLVSKFKFRPENIRLLTEDEGKKGTANRPTRANIERAFKKLAGLAGPGDKVVVFLAGHGSQQTSDKPDDLDYPEPDGLDEVFLPSDVKEPDRDRPKWTNAIVDKELARWLKAIRARGATLVVIVDACHSATLVRAAVGARPRGIPVEDFVSQEVLRKARERAPQKRDLDIPLPWKMAGEEPDLVALYAAQSTESALEDWMPHRTSLHREKHGVFTYTLVQVLEQAARPLTYTEAIQRVHARVQARTIFSLPLVEGKDRDREFLGEKEWPGRSRFVLRKRDGKYVVNAGYLHGFNPGSILAVHPPADRPGHETAVGHVKVVDTRVLEATVQPVAHGKLPEVADLPDGGYCKPVYLRYGSLKLRVALDGPVPEDVRRALDRLDKKPGGTLIEVTSRDRAQWLVRLEEGKLTLLPAGPRLRGGGLPEGAVSDPGHRDDPADWLDDRLSRIARARNLIRLASDMGAEASDLKIEAELVRFPTNGKGVPIPWTDKGLKLTAGDKFGVRIHNRGRYGAWVTILFIDSRHGILPFYPLASDRVDNLVDPSKPFTTPPVKVSSKTLGLEHMVVIAVKADNRQEAVDFRWLCQKTLAEARGLRGADRALDSPLGELLQTAAFASGDTRGIEMSSLGDHAVRLLSFRTLQGDNTPPGAAAEGPVPGSGRKFPWEPVLYVGGGVVAGAALVLLLSRRPRPAP